MNRPKPIYQWFTDDGYRGEVCLSIGGRHPMLRIWENDNPDPDEASAAISLPDDLGPLIRVLLSVEV